ncbi:MAG: hypothetical protein INR65_11150 [Gluconacetobacter diazotrophicus]|nr:hypothetical protein [Gluconacetobacter diazotrophicus]
MTAGEWWELAGPGGAERWQRVDGRFVAAEVGTKRLVPAERPFDADQLGLRRGRCGHPGPWPNAFGHCPDCGAALEPPETTDGWSWANPADGFAVAGRAVRPVPDSRREEAMPGAALLFFVVAGRPAHLFAVDGRSGWLRARREADGAWVELERLRPAGLQRRSWAAAVLDGGAAFVVPTEAGPVVVRCPADAPLSVTEVAGSGACAGGAAALGRGAVAVPVRGAAGLGMALLAAGSAEWRAAPVAGGDAAAREEVFAAPAAHDDDVFWCGTDGLLTLSVRNGGVEAAYRRWDAGMVPVAGTRPLRAPDGRLFQLFRQNEAELVFGELALPGRSGERRTASSLWLSAGDAVFGDGRRRRLPWDEGRGRGEYPLGNNEFLLPVLTFDERRFLLLNCPGRDTLGRFLGADGTGEARRGTLLFTGATRSVEALQGGVEAREPADVTGFVFRNRLWAYAAVSNRCWSWELAAVEAG